MGPRVQRRWGVGREGGGWVTPLRERESTTVVSLSFIGRYACRLTLEKRFLPPLLPGFELASFRSRVRRSYQQAVPAYLIYVIL